MKTDFKFIKSESFRKWVVLARRRAKRPDIARGKEPICPFCSGREALTPKEVYRKGQGKENMPGWQIRVVPNKYPFAPVHELIIHSPAHKDDFFTYKTNLIADIFRVFKERYCYWEKEGQVLILHNSGIEAGESLPHSHSQLVVIPNNIPLDSPKAINPENTIHESGFFAIFAPKASSWPYEVWFLPRQRGNYFGEIDNAEINDLASIFSKTLLKLKKTQGKDFPFNFYIYPGKDWYLRLIPRLKVPGGFELGSGIFVNTQAPEETARELAW